MKLSNHLLLLVLIAPTAWCFNGVLSRKHGGRPPLNIGTNHWQPLKKASQRVGVNWSYTSLSASPAAPLSPAALGYMSLLALQFGLQPIFTRAFAPKTICRSTIVMMQEVAKLITAAILLHVSGGWNSSLAGWSIKSSSLVAGIPAALYVVQNYCSLVAYQNLTPVTFNVLNQTKTLSAALFCFLIMGRIQSKLQILSLVVLSVAALVLEKVLPLPWKIGRTQDATVAEGDDQTHFSSGVLPILAASSISGLAGALTQNTLEAGRNSFLMTMEISSFSMIFLGLTMLISDDGKQIRQDSFWKNWTLKTWIPVLTNAAGGIIVGLVTKHAGSVRKGFALIFGLLLSGLFQARGSDGISSEQIIGGALAALSLWMHSKFPAAIM